MPQVMWSVVAEQSSALNSSSGVVRMWVRIPAWPVAALVSLSKTLNHNCFVLRMGCKAVGPVCCVMHVKEPRTLIVKEKRLAPVILDSCLEHPAGWICVRYKSSVLLLLNWRGQCRRSSSKVKRAMPQVKFLTGGGNAAGQALNWRGQCHMSSYKIKGEMPQVKF